MRSTAMLVASVLLVGAGCASDDGWVGGLVVCPVPDDAASCIRALADLCKPGRCSSYDEDVRALENDVARGTCAGALASVRLGTCGELRFTATGHAFGGTTHYYDASGILVAARIYTDALVPGGCNNPPFGFSPECQKVVTRDLCGERPPAP